MIHTPGSRYCSLQDLRELPTPAAQELGPRHFPVSHAALVETLLEKFSERRWGYRKLKLGVAAQGAQVFGTVEVSGPGLPQNGLIKEEMGTTLGFRSSVNKSLAVRGIAGQRVFVCDNMSFAGSGEFSFKHKHTRYLNLPHLVESGLNNFTHEVKGLQDDIVEMQETSLDTWQAKVRLFDIFNGGILPQHLLDDVSRLYFHADDDMTDCQGHTVWSLNNACTRALAKLKPYAQHTRATGVGEHFKRQQLRGDSLYERSQADVA
tara:strand:+ start:584 stop:1372 length:789 start_codon:yes stop_codon:yes gene_type:complete